VQRVTVAAELTRGADFVVNYDEGTEIYKEAFQPAPGARSGGLRILRARAEGDSLRLLVEGHGEGSYTVRVRTPREVGEAPGVRVLTHLGRDAVLVLDLDGPQGTYVRRELVIPLKRPK
jgi:hypothetical protein